jgi:uncharacterized membrane protein YfcA
VALAGLPGVLLGSLVGQTVFRRLAPGTFRHIVFLMLALSGIVALTRAVLR